MPITNVLGLNVCSVTVKLEAIEGCACKRRLSTIVLLIALAYTCAIIQGIDIRMSKVERYICRPKEQARIQRRHSNFWLVYPVNLGLINLGLGRSVDAITFIRLYYQRGLHGLEPPS